MKNLERFFITRHSKKPKGNDKESSQYPGISEQGVVLAGERAKDIGLFLENTDPGAIIFLGGNSDAVRTKSTAKAYVDALKENGAQDIVVIKELRNALATVIGNPDKKVVLSCPLSLKELSIRRWIDQKGSLTEYAAKLLEKNNNDEYEMTKDWIRTDGKLGELTGVKPIEVAESYRNALLRLRRFVRKLVKDRSVIVGMVGHSMDIDIFATYMANGKIDIEGFERVSQGKLIKETEMLTIESEKGEVALSYRNNVYRSQHAETQLSDY